MTRKRTVAETLDAIGAGQFLRPVVRCLREQRECLRRIPWQIAQRRRIREYLNGNERRKLHLGASDMILPGWLNTDLFPHSRETVFMDAARPFPLPELSLDYVYCEHFIEHISIEGAASCFAEVYRCLKRGGVFRVATPDLQQYVGLFSGRLGPDQEKFLQSFGAFFKLEHVSPCQALNHLAYNWGHRFLYTRDELLAGLRHAGFSEVVAKQVGESDHDVLRSIEQHGKFFGDDLNRFETMVLEASK